MIRNVLSHVGGVGAYGVISVVLFFTVFTVAVVWALVQRRSLMNELAALPLADDAKPLTPGQPHHESHE